MSAQGQLQLTGRQRLWFLACLSLGIALRLPQLSASFYGDEAFSALRDSQALLPISDDRFRPLFFSLLFLWRQLGMHGEAGLRGLPVALGIAQIPVAFLLGRALFGFGGALTLATLIAVSPLSIELSQELRMYSLVPLLALLQALLLVRLSRAAQERQPTRALWIAFTLVAIAGVYTHLHYFFFLAGAAVWLWRSRARLELRPAVLSLASVGLCYLPNLPNVLRFSRQSGLQQHFAAADLLSALPKLAAAFSLGFNYFALPQLGLARAVRWSVLTANLTISLPVLIAVLILSLALLRAHREPRMRAPLELAHCLCSLPIALAFVVEATSHKSFLQPKYMVFSAPFFLLLLTAAFLQIEQVKLRVITALLWAVVMGVAFVHWLDPVHYGRREDWRGVTAILRDHTAADSPVLMLGGWHALQADLWYYYAPSLASRMHQIMPPAGNASAQQLGPALRELAQGHAELHYVWWDTLRNTLDPNDLVLRAARLAFQHEERKQLNPRLILYSFRTR